MNKKKIKKFLFLFLIALCFLIIFYLFFFKNKLVYEESQKESNIKINLINDFIVNFIKGNEIKFENLKDEISINYIDLWLKADECKVDKTSISVMYFLENNYFCYSKDEIRLEEKLKGIKKKSPLGYYSIKKSYEKDKIFYIILRRIHKDLLIYKINISEENFEGQLEISKKIRILDYKDIEGRFIGALVFYPLALKIISNCMEKEEELILEEIKDKNLDKYNLLMALYLYKKDKKSSLNYLNNVNSIKDRFFNDIYNALKFLLNNGYNDLNCFQQKLIRYLNKV